MTQAIFALLYSRLGDGEKAYHWFKDAYEPNLNPPFRVIAETKGGTNPYFSTGAGGILQSLDGFWRIGYHSEGHCSGKICITSTMEKPYTKGRGG